MSDKIRVLRILEYTGDREAIEEHFKNILKGQRSFRVSAKLCPENGPEVIGEVTIRAATLGEFPEILKGEDETAI